MATVSETPSQPIPCAPAGEHASMQLMFRHNADWPARDNAMSAAPSDRLTCMPPCCCYRLSTGDAALLLVGGFGDDGSEYEYKGDAGASLESLEDAAAGEVAWQSHSIQAPHLRTSHTDGVWCYVCQPEASKHITIYVQHSQCYACCRCWWLAKLGPRCTRLAHC
jgi:hypothetical protein